MNSSNFHVSGNNHIFDVVQNNDHISDFTNNNSSFGNGSYGNVENQIHMEDVDGIHVRELMDNDIDNDIDNNMGNDMGIDMDNGVDEITRQKVRLTFDMVMILLKYLNSDIDIINLMKVSHEYKDLNERLFYNPVSCDNPSLYPNMQTQHFFYPIDYLTHRKPNNYSEVIWYNVDSRLTGTYIQRQPNTIFKNLTFEPTNDILNAEEFIVPANEFKVIPQNAFTRSKLKRIDLLNVNTIERSAFFQSEIVSIRIPFGVKTIPFKCFAQCSNLKEVNLPNGLKVIGDQSFYDCKELSSIEIPESVTCIGKEAFKKCISLDCEIPDYLEELCKSAFENTNLSVAKIPSGITRLEEKCFAYCPNLKCIIVQSSIDIPPLTFKGDKNAFIIYTFDLQCVPDVPASCIIVDTTTKNVYATFSNFDRGYLELNDILDNNTDDLRQQIIYLLAYIAADDEIKQFFLNAISDDFKRKLFNEFNNL